MAVRPDTERVFGTEEAIAKAIVEFLKTEKEKTKTLSDLDDEEIGVISLLDTMASSLKINVLKKFVENFCQYRVSRFRLGRREIGTVISWAGIGTEERRRVRSIRELFGGLRH